MITQMSLAAASVILDQQPPQQRARVKLLASDAAKAFLRTRANLVLSEQKLVAALAAYDANSEPTAVELQCAYNSRKNWERYYASDYESLVESPEFRELLAFFRGIDDVLLSL